MLFSLSTLLLALDSVFKEARPRVLTCDAAFGIMLTWICAQKIFRDARARRGKQLDIFIVNTFGSCWQAFFTFLLLPMNAALRGVRTGPAFFPAPASTFAAVRPPSAPRPRRFRWGICLATCSMAWIACSALMAGPPHTLVRPATRHATQPGPLELTSPSPAAQCATWR